MLGVMLLQRSVSVVLCEGLYRYRLERLKTWFLTAHGSPKYPGLLGGTWDFN